MPKYVLKTVFIHFQFKIYCHLKVESLNSLNKLHIHVYNKYDLYFFASYLLSEKIDHFFSVQVDHSKTLLRHRLIFIKFI